VIEQPSPIKTRSNQNGLSDDSPDPAFSSWGSIISLRVRSSEIRRNLTIPYSHA